MLDLPTDGAQQQQPFAKLIAAAMAKSAGKATCGAKISATASIDDMLATMVAKASPAEQTPSVAALMAQLMAANQSVQPQNIQTVPLASAQQAINKIDVTTTPEAAPATAAVAQPVVAAAPIAAATPTAKITASSAASAATEVPASDEAPAGDPAATTTATAAAATTTTQAVAQAQAVRMFRGVQASTAPQAEQDAPAAVAAGEAGPAQAVASASPNAAAAAMAYTQQIAAHANASSPAQSGQQRISPEALADMAKDSGAVVAGTRKQVEPAAEALLSGTTAATGAAQATNLVEVSAAPKADSAQSSAAADTPLAQQISDTLAASNARGRDQVVIQLNPPELGKVRAVFQSDGDGVRCTLQVDNPHTLAQIRSETPALLARLADSGVEIKHVETSLRETGSNAAFSMLSDGSGQQQFQGQWQQPSAWRSPFVSAFAPEPAAAAAAPSPLSGGDGSVNVWL